MHQNASFGRINYMEKNTKLLFSNLDVFEPEPGLYEKILQKIEIKRMLVSRHRFFVFLILLILSLVAVVPVVKMLISDFSSSGFIQFFSLMFSDSSIILSHWKTFVLTLLESLPIVSTVLFLILLFIALESIRSMSRDIKFLSLNNQAN